MKTKIKKTCSKKIYLLVLLFFTQSLFGQVINDAQQIPGNHWVYDAFEILNAESGTASFTESAPLSVAELRFYLQYIDYEKLSEAGKELYDKVNLFLFNRKNFLSQENARLLFNPKLNPEIYYKSNKDLAWSFNYNYIDNAVTIPVLIGFNDSVCIETDFFYGRNHESSQDPDNFCNIPYDGGLEHLWPKKAYGSFVNYFDDWGIAFQIGKEGLQLGKSNFGSVIFNSTFETDSYVQLNLFNNLFKYSCDAVQVNVDKFMYLHQIDARIAKFMKIGLIEGGLVNDSFELRYLNPLMILHNFYSACDRKKLPEDSYNLSNHYCAYMGVIMDFYPIDFLHIHLLYAQNEIQTSGELTNGYGTVIPDGYGVQCGIDTSFPLSDKSFLKASIEGMYTTPFLYIKQSPDWSLMRSRISQNESNVNSWIGTPFGPDCFALNFNIGFEKPLNYQVDFGYLFTVHGENSFDIFTNKREIDGVEYYDYYPQVKYAMGDDFDECSYQARKKGVTGTPEYKHQFSLHGKYYFMKNFSINGKATYEFAINNNNIQGNFDQGIELALALSFSTF